jgi:hypothetical protein
LYVYIKPPRYEAEAPIKIKTRENPKTNKNVEKNTFFRIPELYSSVNSSIENPVIKVKYAGIRGSTQGEKKDRSPATNAAGNETVSVNIIALKPSKPDRPRTEYGIFKKRGSPVLVKLKPRIH